MRNNESASRVRAVRVAGAVGAVALTVGTLTVGVASADPGGGGRPVDSPTVLKSKEG